MGYRESQDIKQTLDVREIAAAILTHLDPADGWRVVNPSADGEQSSMLREWVSLVGSDGRKLHLHLEVAREGCKLRVSGEMPQANVAGSGTRWYESSTARNPSPIYLGATRPAKALAGEISRRLLGDYYKAWAAGCHQRDLTLAGHARARTAAARCAALLGTEPRRAGGSWNHHERQGSDLVTDWEVTRHESPVSLELLCHYYREPRAGFIDIDLTSLTEPQALEILGLVRAIIDRDRVPPAPEAAKEPSDDEPQRGAGVGAESQP